MKIFCSGIGGIGLSAYASQMRIRGHEVCGSDKADSAVIRALRELGISVSLSQDGSAFPEGTDLLVYSEAIQPDAPERVIAGKKGIRSISYFKALGELTKDTELIAICGTHGKSSTTAMAAKVLIDAGKDPNVVVGTKMDELNGKNWRKGDGDLWVVEACEYRRSFHFLSPKLILLTNADGDHFDAFRDMDDYEQAFVDFIGKLPEGAPVIAHGNDTRAVSIIKKAGKKLVDADLMPFPTIATPGLHMRQNAQLTLALAEYLKLDKEKTLESLKNFKGTWRRMELKGETSGGVTVIDDYAHHPAEIKATLAAMREAYPGRRIVCAFQPHTHDRTLKLWKEFSVSFRGASLVIIPNIYDARAESDSGKADVSSFVKAVSEGSEVTCINGKSIPDALDFLKKELKHGDVLVVMGAGNITNLAGDYLKSN